MVEADKVFEFGVEAEASDEHARPACEPTNLRIGTHSRRGPRPVAETEQREHTGCKSHPDPYRAVCRWAALTALVGGGAVPVEEMIVLDAHLAARSFHAVLAVELACLITQLLIT